MVRKKNLKILLISFLVVLLLVGITQISLAVGGDGDIARCFVVDDPHASEYCTDNAITMREFAPNSIMTNGVVDPFFAKGGTQFFPTDRPSGKAKIYVIAVDFTDLKGEVGVPYGLQRNIFMNQGSIYDLSDPQVIYESTFFGSNGFNGSANYEYFGANGVKNMNPSKFQWGTSDPAQDFKGLVQIMNEVSLGTFEIEVECLNAKLAELQGLDPETDKWPWFHLDGPMIGYAVQGPADCEDYRQFARLHQAAIDAAYRDLDNLDIEDIDLIYTVVPISAFGHRAGLQGGGGLDTSFSFNDQALLQRDSEFRHEPGITTKEGRIVGSGVFGIKNLWSSGNPRSAVSTSTHEFLHGMGGFDDYYYNWMPYLDGNSVSSAINYKNTGESSPGSRFGTDTQDLTSWRKYRQGWIPDEEIKVILPGDKETLFIRATSSYAGDGGTYTDDPSILTRMVLIPKEWRTRDTFGILWGNGWNPKKTDYNWYDWFTNPWVGGETRAIKSFPTFYTVESRKQLGADNTMNADNQGVVVSMIANPTWETGHGGGGFKLCSGSSGLKKDAVWGDPNLGLTITVLESNVFYDKVEIDYKGVATSTVNPEYPGPAQHVYQGVLTASDNYVQTEDTFTVNFDIFTLGVCAVNDIRSPATVPTESAPYDNGVIRVATPLGVPGGISGFEMEVKFDPETFEYVAEVESDFFGYEVDDTDAEDGLLIVTAVGTSMIDKNTILGLQFMVKEGVVPDDYMIESTIFDVTLQNWRGETLNVGDAGFDGIGTIKDADGNISTDPLADLYKSYIDGGIICYPDYTDYEPAIFSKGGVVHVGNAPTYTVSGQIVCDTPGSALGTFIGIESEVTLYNKDGVITATTKSDWDGNYSIPGVLAGEGYYITAKKPKYFDGESEPFDVITTNVTNADLQLLRLTFIVSGTIYGSINSDGSGALPLAGVDVYVLNIGNAYKVLGGPYTTDENGKYEIDAKVETWNKPFAAVAVDVTGTDYGAQMFANGLKLNLGGLYGIDPSDRVYPENTSTYGVGGGYNFLLDKNITNRNVTLTKKQEVHIRIATKSTEIYYQLMKQDGTLVGDLLQSKGTTNGDDVFQNVEPGSYYIEVSREGYISVCTMPFTVDSTRIFLRNAPSSNTFDLVAEDFSTRLGGTISNALTGELLEGVEIIVVPYANNRGLGTPILSDEDGEFSYPDTGGIKDIIFYKAGYAKKTITLLTDGVSDLEIELLPAYTVTFHPENGEDDILMDDVEHSTKIKEPTEVTREGYVLIGWYADLADEESLWDFEEDTVTGPHHLYAKWVKTYIISAIAHSNGSVCYYDVEEETYVPFETMTVNKGDHRVPSIIADRGYIIDSLKVNGEEVEGASGKWFWLLPLLNISEDITIEITFKPGPTCTVTFVVGEGGHVYPGGAITVPYRGAVKYLVWADLGYVIDLVIIDGDEYDDSQGYTSDGWHTWDITDDIVIEVSFTEVDPPEKTVTITASAGPEGIVAPSGATIIEEGGYQWFYIKANKYYAIDFVAINGDPCQNDDSTYVLHGETEGFFNVFDIGDEDTFTITFMYIGPETHTVTFNSNGGTAVPDQTVIEGENVIKPMDPTKTGHRFDGWFKEEALTNAFNFVTETITGDITLYAKWTLVYIVTFHPDGGTPAPAVQTINAGGKAAAPPAMTKTGYTFAGWYTNSALTGSVYNFETSVTANLDLYAKWETSGSGTGSGNTGDIIIGPLKPSLRNILGNDIQGPTFKDVPATHWAYQYVEYLARRDYVKGKSATLYAPSDPITRAEFVTILARMEGAAQTDYSGPFTDVVPGSYYAGAVDWAVKAGVTIGTSDTTFSPGRTISRQEIAAMLARYVTYKLVTLVAYNQPISFTDEAQIAAYAKDYVKNMQTADVINGYPDGSFKPLNNATRAEAAKMLALVHYLMNYK